MKAAFLAAMSHELKTPLANIRALAATSANGGALLLAFALTVALAFTGRDVPRTRA